MKQLLFLLLFSSSYAMDHEIVSIDQEQQTTAPVLRDPEKGKNYSLDALNLAKFVTDMLPQKMQEQFVTDVDAKEWQKFALTLDKDSHQWYQESMNSIYAEKLLSPEEKNTLCVQILAKTLMYRCTTSKGHKLQKHKSIEQTQTYQKASIGSVVVGGIITIVTNLLQHFLTKK